MNKYLVSYDLRKQRDYTSLISALKKLGGQRVLESVWLLASNLSAEDVANQLLREMDRDDGIIVAQYVNYVYCNLLV